MHALFRGLARAHANRTAAALLLDGLARVAQQIHEHLLELRGVAHDHGQRGIQVQFEAGFLRSHAEALQFHGAHDHLVEGHAAALRGRFAGAEEQLAQNSAGALGFEKNLAHLGGATGGIFAEQQALGVAEDAGQGIAELVGHAGDHLAEGGEFFRLQQLRLKNALRG